SSFGISGTNAHVIIEQGDPLPDRTPGDGVMPLPITGRTEADLRTAATAQPAIRITDAGPITEQDDPAPHSTPDDTVLPLPITPRTEADLRAHAERLRAAATARPDIHIADVGRSLATRAAFGHRAVVLASDVDEWVAGLDAIAAGRRSASVVTG